ncbi:MAG TPA: hypothetical protein VF316_21375 [Polyangiaceae bacterium]
MATRSSVLFPLLVLTYAACTTHTDPAGTLVIGVQTDDLNGAVGSFRLTTTVDGAPQADKFYRADRNIPLFPQEIAVDGKGNAKAAVEVRVEGYPGVDPTSLGPTLLTRTARTAMVPGKDLLLRIRLESRCSTGLVGGVPGPTCSLPNQTCIAGVCTDDLLPASALEPYVPNWPQNTPDLCRPANPGPPEVIVGTGQTDYLPLTDGQVVQAELGPQGGHHFYVAIRLKNLKRSGSTTTISGLQPGTNIAIPPTSFVFTFDGDEGGYCKLYGLRYQLDNGGIDWTQFLGKPLDVTVKVKDNTGAEGTGVAHINIATTVIGG